MPSTPTRARVLLVSIVTAAALAANARSVWAACDVNYTGAANGLWQSTGNWDTNAVPTNAQIACIPAGKGTIDIANGVSATAKSIQALSRMQIDAGGSLTTTDNTPNAFSDTVTDFVINAGATFTVGNAGVAANGTVVLEGAIAGPGSIRLDGGSLRGSGMVAASIQNVGGTVQPGGPGLVGTLTVGGAFNQGVGGTLEIDLASDSSFDKIHGPTFNHYVDGTIVVTLLGGYLPSVVGTTWDFIPPDGPGTSVPATVTPPEFIAHPISMGAAIELSSPLSTTTTTLQPVCGDGIVIPDEQCDGSAFGEACPDVKDDSSCRRCTTDCTLDCSLCGATIVDSFILPSVLVVKLNTKTPAKSKLVAGGIFDTGPDATDLGASATFQVGGISVAASAPERAAGGFVLKDTGLLFKVVPAKTGSSKAKFKLKVQRDLTGQVDPEAPLTMRFTNPTVDGIGTVKLSGGKYRLRRKPGDLVAPALFLVSVRTHLAGGGKDSLTMRLGFATDGQVPATAPDVTVAFGPTFTAAIPGSALSPKGSGFAGSAGGVQVTLDFRRELLTVRAKKVDLGTFADGAQAVLVAASLDGDTRANEVRMVKKGKAIRY